jgi:hypothetical protein
MDVMTMKKLAYESPLKKKEGSCTYMDCLVTHPQKRKQGTMYIHGKLGDSSSEEGPCTYMESFPFPAFSQKKVCATNGSLY